MSRTARQTRIDALRRGVAAESEAYEAAVERMQPAMLAWEAVVNGSLRNRAPQTDAERAIEPLWEALRAITYSYGRLHDVTREAVTLSRDAVGELNRRTDRMTEKRIADAAELAALAKELRERGSSITKVAKALNRSPRQVSRYFAGDKPAKRQ
ncbi:hypothetical protein BH24CHL6_BH24CHL6_15370 [soil metagenome]